MLKSIPKKIQILSPNFEDIRSIFQNIHIFLKKKFFKTVSLAFF